MCLSPQKESVNVDLHECCEEYAENCVSCNLHQNIRRDERQLIANLLDQLIDWKNPELRNRVLSIASKGSSINKPNIVEHSTIEVEEDSAYIWIEKQSIKPPLSQISEVDCLIDVDADKKIIGVEILGWPTQEKA